MTDRDNKLWLRLWRERRTAFHQSTVNPLLIRFWSSLALKPGSRVFVPLCGKSLDMIWLAEQGHRVVGVELSPIAVRDFFHENKLKPKRRKIAGFTLWTHGNISILCGDFFKLDSTVLRQIDTIYDRAALTALPEDLRKNYVRHLRKIAPQTPKVFLLTTEDNEADDPPEHSFNVDAEVATLYSEFFSIDLAHVESVFETDPDAPDLAPIRADYKLYRLTSNSPPQFILEPKPKIRPSE